MKAKIWLCWAGLALTVASLCAFAETHNLTNCEICRARTKSPIVCGELAAIVGYIPGVEIKADAKAHRVDLRVKDGAGNP